MNILLAAINAKYIHSNLAVYSLRAYARRYMEETKIAEYTINQPIDEILMDIYTRKPDILCISCYLWNISYVRQLIREIPKVLPDTKIWLGGPEVSYNAGEISQVLETEDGLAVVRVDKVIESHPKDIDSVRGEIEELWTVNEKAAIAQEMLNNLMYDLENGDALPAAAKRYGLKVYRSQPVTRNETFANIGYADIREMFTEPLNTPKQIQQGDDYVIAVAEEDYKNSAPLSENEQLLIKRKAYQSLLTDYAEAMLSSFADEYDISIQYKLLGFEY